MPKHIAFLGDSITMGYGLPDSRKRFSTKICKALGAYEENYGITGTLVANAGTSRANGLSFVERLPIIRSADLAIVFGGTNDYFWSDRPIFNTEGGGLNNEYFSDAVETVCSFCANERESGTTLIVTPYPHRGIGNFLGGEAWNTRSEHDTDTVNFNGHTLCDYVKVISDTARSYGLPVLDLHKVSGFDYRYHTLDGCHPNDDGHALLAEYIGRDLRKLI